MFGFFNINTTSASNELGYGDSSYSDDPLLGLKQELSYKDCMNIYRFWPLGKRIASVLPNFALSADRSIFFDGLPPEFVEEFKRIELDYNIVEIVRNASIYTRIYGMAAIYVAHSDVECDKTLHYKDLQKGNLSFNLQDPLNLNGIVINQDPLSTSYQKVSNIMINGKSISSDRICVTYNDLLWYLQYTPSTFSFGPQSVYQNMVGLIKSWNRCVVALERMSTKAGSIVYKNRSGGVVNSIVATAAKKSLELIRQMQNDGAASIDTNDSIEFFNLTGVEVVDNIIDKMNQIILMALSDTPAAILLDKELAQGFGNGSEDMKAILMSVDNFRKSMLTPIYTFLDKYLLYITLSPSFLKSVIEKYPEDLRGYTEVTLRELAIQNYRFEWGNLYPEPESVRIDSASKKLDNLMKLKELGCNLSDIEEIVNNDKDLYTESLEFNEPTPDTIGDLDGYDYNSSDYSASIDDDIPLSRKLNESRSEESDRRTETE